MSRRRAVGSERRRRRAPHASLWRPAPVAAPDSRLCSTSGGSTSTGEPLGTTSTGLGALRLGALATLGPWRASARSTSMCGLSVSSLQYAAPITILGSVPTSSTPQASDRRSTSWSRARAGRDRAAPHHRSRGLRSWTSSRHALVEGVPRTRNAGGRVGRRSKSELGDEGWRRRSGRPVHPADLGHCVAVPRSRSRAGEHDLVGLGHGGMRGKGVLASAPREGRGRSPPHGLPPLPRLADSVRDDGPASPRPLAPAGGDAGRASGRRRGGTVGAAAAVVQEPRRAVVRRLARRARPPHGVARCRGDDDCTPLTFRTSRRARASTPRRRAG